MRHSYLIKTGGAAALAAGLAAGGFSVASAASSTGTAAVTPSGGAGPTYAGPGGPDAPGGPGGGGFGHRGPGGGTGHRGPGGGPGGDPGGVITSLGAGSITVKGRDGSTRSITTNSSTTYTRDGSSSTAGALALGERIRVRPTPGSPPAAGATASVPPSPPAPTTPVKAAAVDIIDPVIRGTVEAVSGSTVTVSDPDGFYRQVNLDNSTTYTSGGKSASSSAVVHGAKVIAFGTVSSDHLSLDASKVNINPVEPARP